MADIKSEDIKWPCIGYIEFKPKPKKEGMK